MLTFLTDDVDGLYGGVPGRPQGRAQEDPEAGHTAIRAAAGACPLECGSCLMTDPAGRLRPGRAAHLSDDQHHLASPKAELCERALHKGTLFANCKEDPAGAAKIIEQVLRLADERPSTRAS